MEKSGNKPLSIIRAEDSFKFWDSRFPLFRMLGSAQLNAVIDAAHGEMLKLGHFSIDSEHLLLGLTSRMSGAPHRVLAKLGVTLGKARMATEDVIGRGSGIRPEARHLTPRAKRIIESAVKRCAAKRQILARTNELLLSLLDDPYCVAVRVLENMGVSREKLRFEMIAAMPSATRQRQELKAKPMADWKPFLDVELFPSASRPNEKSLLESLSEQTNEVMLRAQAEAKRVPHRFVGQEHILAAIINGSGHTAHHLRRCGATLDGIRRETDSLLEKSELLLSEIPLSQGAETLLQVAKFDSMSVGERLIEPDHLLLAILREHTRGNAAKILEKLGADVDKLTEVTFRDISMRLALRDRQSKHSRDTESRNQADEQPTFADLPTMFSGWETLPDFVCELCCAPIKREAHVCIHCYSLVSDSVRIECRFCHENIRKRAVKCRHCKKTLVEASN